MRPFLVAASIAAILATASVADAQILEAGEADCTTPRRALLTWLANLQDGEEQGELATRCFDWRAARIGDPAEQVELSRRFKRVLDARGLYVQVEEIPDEASPEGMARVVPFPNNLPGFVVVKNGNQWMISVETIRNIHNWHDETFAFDVEHTVESLPSWLREDFIGAQWWQWFSIIILIVLALLLRQLVSWVVHKQGTKLLASLVKRLDPALLGRAAMPIGTVASIFLVLWVFPTLRLGVDFNRVASFGLRVAAAVSGVLIVYRLVDVLSDVMAKRAELTDTKLDDQIVPLVRKSLKVVTVVLGVIFVLQNMEVDVASLLAGVSLGGLAFTLAARDTVANLFGSLSIFADQPFQVGDWVVMQGVEGIVEEVGMRSTRVRTFYRSLVSIPNSKVADGVIDNYGARESRRTFIKLGVQYDTTPEQIEAFCDGIRAVMAANPAVKKDAYHVYFSGFADSSLEVMLYFFFTVGTWQDELRQRHLVFLEILRLAKALKIQFAFPTRTVHVATRATPTDVHPTVPLEHDAMTAAVLAFGPGGELSRPGGPKISHGFYPGAAVRPGSDPDAELRDSRI